jgi:hypothetical protein
LYRVCKCTGDYILYATKYIAVNLKPNSVTLLKKNKAGVRNIILYILRGRDIRTYQNLLPKICSNFMTTNALLPFFKDCTTVHRDRFLVNKTNRLTEFQLYYWYYDSTCFGQSFCLSSGVSYPYNGIGTFMLFGERVLPGAGWNCSSILLLVALGHLTA